MREDEQKFSKISLWFLGVKEKIEKNAGSLFMLAILLVWLGMFLSQEVSLVNTDLGRHIENGRYFFETHKIPDTNLYSYTYPDIPFINHHWGSGVVFYLIWKYVGLSGLSFFYVALSFLTFCILFLETKKYAGLALTVLSAVLVIPLIGERTEIRPEVFSYLFAAIYFILLWKFQKGKLQKMTLFLLPCMSLLWVNLHIYFIFGLGLMGLFLLDTLREKDWSKFKTLFFVLILSFSASLANPFGLKAVLYPLNIFRNYGYRVLENQSVSFLTRIGFINNPNLLIFKIVLFILLASIVLLFLTNRKKINWPLLGLSIVISILGWSALRNFSLFGYFALPAIAYSLKFGLRNKINLNDGWSKIVVLSLASLFFLFFSYLFQGKLLRENRVNSTVQTQAQNASVIFFKANNLSGPIFNNYDIGGYLIFHLFPKEKVFVDNRPEAYSDVFFQEVYIPMQENDDIWNRMSQEYAFNAIYFATSDVTNWGQEFLVKRIKDPEWAPVFADDYAIIFLKRNEKNKDLISRFEMSQDHFRVTGAQ
ncbi:MAG: hypothetical protein WCO05_03540 [Candidatus Moraniibacteriota bacterium]|jgi:hypothetical protein